jgi:hypothetical protein
MDSNVVAGFVPEGDERRPTCGFVDDCEGLYFFYCAFAQDRCRVVMQVSWANDINMHFFQTESVVLVGRGILLIDTSIPGQ